MRSRSVVLVGFLVLASLRSVWAADDLSRFIGRPVASITVDAGGRTAADEVLSLVIVQKGAPLDLDAVRASVRSLVTVGRFESVEVLATDGADGVAIVFKVLARRAISDVIFTGDTGLSADDLSNRVHQQYGVIPATVRPEAIVRTVTSILQDEGYLGATAQATVVDGPTPDRANLSVTVQAGHRAVIRTLKVTGQSTLSTAMVELRTGASVGAPYRRRAIDDALVKLRDSLRGESFYGAEASVESDTASADGTAVDLVLHVDAGPKVLGPFFTGDPPPPGNINDLVPMKTEHSADDDLLDDARARIEALLRRDGYRDARAPYTKTPTPQGLDVSFAIARGALYRVGHVTVKGNDTLPTEIVTRLLGVTEGAPYSQVRVLLGKMALEAEYTRRGYYKEIVTPAVTDGGQPGSGSTLVDVAFTIVEGPAARITEVVFEPATPQVPALDLRTAMRSRSGDPYVVATSGIDRATLETLYHDRGFPNAQVKITPSEAGEPTSIRLTVAIDEGPQIFVQDIRVIGNHRVDTPAILDAMVLKPGQPLGAADIQRSRQHVQESFGLRSVSIVSEPVFSDDKRAHVIVSVEEAPATTISWGGGLLVDSRQVIDEAGGPTTQHFDFGPRGSVEVTRQNLGGRNRAIDFFARVGVRSNPNVDGDPFGFIDYLGQTRYDEHRLFQLPLDLSFGASVERDVQTNFNYYRQILKTEAIYRASRHVAVTGGYALEFTQLFDNLNTIPEDEQLQIDRRFAQVRLSILSSGVLWDRRNDPIAPTNGALMSANVDVAPKAIGSEVGFAKTLLQISGYRALDDGRRFVAAARAELGLAHGFDQQAFLDASGNPVLDQNGQPIFVAGLPASERFYAGGGSTVRGFSEDVLGVPQILTPDGFSLGGNGLVVLNLELRTRLFTLGSKYDVGIVTFADAGNVFLNASNVSLTQLRGTLGFGARVNSPIGPVRLDFGFKLTRLEFNNKLEPGWTFHLSVGQAF
jgi:outer membrane protein assembly complex protein YaeT